MPDEDAFTLARAKRILPLLPDLYAAREAKDLAKLIDVADTIFDADQDAMGAFEEDSKG
jgi:hypothetical protein